MCALLVLNLHAMSHFEIEIKSLLGEAQNAEALKAKMATLDPSFKKMSENKQLNHYFEGRDMEQLYKNVEHLFTGEQHEKLKKIIDLPYLNALFIKNIYCDVAQAKNDKP